MDVILELVPNRVFFQTCPDNPSCGIHMNERDGFIYHYHSMDSLYKSVRIRKYFGPISISNVRRHCTLIDSSLKHTAGRHLFYTNNFQTIGYQQKRTSAIFLMGCYLILRQNLSPEETADALHEVTGSVTPFTDMEGSTAHALSLLDCWRALYQGMVVHQWFRTRDCNINIDLCDGSDDVINWIVPGRLLALEDPKEPRYMGRGPRVRYSIIAAFKQQKVETVIRLNSRDYEYRTGYGQPYDSEEFVCRAIKHYDIFFKDGGIPSESQLNMFLKIVKKAPGPVAVHCHAGRGRTGTMIACSLVRYWGFEATHAIAWVRMCRAACIVGIQQGFVKMVENSLREKSCPSAGQGETERHRVHSPTKSLRHVHFVPPTRVRQSVTHKRPNPLPTKLSTSNQTKKESRLEQPGNSEKSVETVTVLSVSGAINGAQRRRLRTSVHSKASKNKGKVIHEPTLEKACKKPEPDGIKAKSKKQREQAQSNGTPKISLNPNTQLRLSSVLDLNLLRKMQKFQEHEPKTKYPRANIADKLSSYITKPGNYQLKRRTVDTAKVARLEAMLQFQSKTTKCEQYELKQNIPKVQDDLRKMHTPKPQIKGSKSSIPFAKTPMKYFSYQPTFDQLTKLLSFEKESKFPLSSCSKDNKVPADSIGSGDPEDKASSHNEKGRQVAWNEPEVSPQCTKSGSVKALNVSGRDNTKDALLLNNFLQKHRQTLLVSKTASCAGGSRDGKIKNIHR